MTMALLHLTLLLLPCGLAQVVGSPAYAAAGDISVSPRCLQGTPGTFSVSGSGLTKATADEAQVSVSISLVNVTAEGAREAAAVRAQAVYDALNDINGLEPQNITTTSVSIYPTTTYNEHLGTSQVIGYTYTNNLQVSVSNVTEDLLAEILDEAVTAGGNNLTINGVEFDLSPGLSYTKTIEARKQAAADARATAQQYADAFEVTLGPILSIVDQSYDSTPVQNSENGQPSEKTLLPSSTPSNAAYSSSNQTPISIGEQSVTASINVIFTICTP